MSSLIDELTPYVVQLQAVDLEGLSGESVASGSYGYVYRVKVNGFPCIAKRLHGILVSHKVSDRERSAIKGRFREECILLSKLRHPNIVQFIGVHYGQTGDDLVLVMEALYTDLDACLEQCLKDERMLPLPLQLSILQDVSYGLLYLHSREPEVIHRDMKASNVLLTRGMRAKIADLGSLKILDLHPLSESAQTVCPGSLGVMPPEALVEHPTYDTKLDLFSFGILILHIVIHRFPVSYVVPLAECKEGVVQIATRRSAIEKMGEQHCLHSLVIQCLQDDPKKRPTAADASAVLEQLTRKHPPHFSDVLQLYMEIEKLEEKSGEVQALKKQVAVQQREITDLQHSLSEAHKKIATLTQELASMKNKYDETTQRSSEASSGSKLEAVTSEKRDINIPHELQTCEAATNGNTETKIGREHHDSCTSEDQTQEVSRETSLVMARLEETSRKLERLQEEKKELEESVEIQRITAKTFEEDFKQERSDREAAHSKIADIEQHYTRQLTAAEKQLQESQTQLERHKLALANTERVFRGNLERMQVMLREKENEVAKLGKELERRDRRIEGITRKRKLTDIERENKQLQDEHIVLRDENQELRMMLGMESSLEMSGKQPCGPLSQHASSSEAIKEGRDYRALTAVYENFFLMHSCQLVAVFEAKGMKRYDAEKLVCFMFMSAYREIIDQTLQEMTDSLRSLFTVPRDPPDLGAILAPYIQLRRACSLDEKREEITTAIQEQVWEKLANPDPTLKEDVPNIDQALQTCTPDLKEILGKATSLAWDLLASLPPMIAKEPPQYNEDIHTYSFHFWDDSLADASLKYFQPVLYRNCMGELAAKGTVVNTS